MPTSFVGIVKFTPVKALGPTFNLWLLLSYVYKFQAWGTERYKHGIHRWINRDLRVNCGMLSSVVKTHKASHKRFRTSSLIINWLNHNLASIYLFRIILSDILVFMLLFGIYICYHILVLSFLSRTCYAGFYFQTVWSNLFVLELLSSANCFYLWL